MDLILHAYSIVKAMAASSLEDLILMCLRLFTKLVCMHLEFCVSAHYCLKLYGLELITLCAGDRSVLPETSIDILVNLIEGLYQV